MVQGPVCTRHAILTGPCLSVIRPKISSDWHSQCTFRSLTELCKKNPGLIRPYLDLWQDLVVRKHVGSQLTRLLEGQMQMVGDLGLLARETNREAIEVG